MCRVDACVELVPSEHKAAIAVIYDAGMQPAMVSSALETLRNHTYELTAALDALNESEITDFFAAIAAGVLR
jgi:hypothetical protein